MATRRAAWSADNPANGWTNDLIWYAAAIHKMKDASPAFEQATLLLVSLWNDTLSNSGMSQLLEIIAGWSDPAGLGYQSQVHDSFLTGGDWPEFGGRRVPWVQCAHDNWFFLPWHRAFLLEFESVCRGHIVGLDGPPDWGLPYWNYSDYAKEPRAAGLPLPLRGPIVPHDVTIPGLDPVAGGTPNPLYDPTRHYQGDAGRPTEPNPAFFADASDALARHHFATKQDKTRASFGGGYLDDEANFHAGSQEDAEGGQVDRQPHGSVHTTVDGNMSSFPTAGLDPIFWMHHANIDRLWETYANEDYSPTSPHGYPFPQGSPTGDEKTKWETRSFTFLRPDGSDVTWTAPQVLSISTLGYSYDRTTAPVMAPLSPEPRGQEEGPFGFAASDPNVVAAAEAISLDTTVDVIISGGDGETAAASPGPWGLWLDGITAQRPAPSSFAVYLGLGPDDEADPSDRNHFVGLLTLFGVYERSIGGVSPGTGSSRAFDISHQVQAQPDFDPLAARVRFVPTDPDRPLADAMISIALASIAVG